MLINCLRCGFSQPKDQYCAQCGVDMQSYKPKAEPILKKILQSGIFQIIVLLTIAVLIGQYIIRGDRQQTWVQKITRFQSVTKASSSSSVIAPPAIEITEASSQSASGDTTEGELKDLKDQEISIPMASAQPLFAASGLAASGNNTNARVAESANENQAPIFRLSYAEVPRETLAKWVNESTNAGLFQNLSEYSAGIITDFRKRTDTSMTTLLTKEIKLAVGQSNTTTSATTPQENGSQVIGLASELQYRANENGIVHGSISVSRNASQGRVDFPAEFDLPRGAVFFMVGALKSNNFANEKTRLTMPPFQILNSVDFMTQKTEFVIIIEPEYK